MAAKKKTADEKTKPGSPSTIRNEAEKRLKESPIIPSELSGQDTERIIYELRVHQIELEMQAEEVQRSHHELEESRDKFLDQYDFAPTGLLTVNEKGAIIEVNLTCSKLLGVERSKLVWTRFNTFVVPKDQDQWYHYITDVLQQEEKQYCTLLLKRAGGSSFPARLEGVRLGSGGIHTEIRIAISDITDIWQAEDALRESEEKYRHLFEYASEAIVVAQDDKLRMVNPRLIQLTGYSEEELLTIPFLSYIHPSHHENIKKIYSRLLRGEHEELFPHYPIQLITRDGGIKWVELGAVKIEWEGRPATLNFLTDITERKVAEEAIHESESRFRTLFEQSNDAVFIADPKTRMLTDCNRKAEYLTGYSRAELLTMKMDTLHPEDVRAETIDNFRGYADGMDTGSDSIVITRDGQRVPVSIIGNQIEIKGQNFLIGSFRDISRQKQVAEALQKAHETLELTVKERTADLFSTNMQLQKEIEDRKVIAESLKEYAKVTFILNEVIITANNAESLPKLFRDTLDKALELLNFEAGGIYLVNPAERTAEIHYTKNLPEDFVKKRRTLRIDAPPYDTLFIKNQPIITDHYEEMSPDLAQKYHIRSMASIPLVSKNKVIGALNVASSKRYTISADEKQVLITIGRELGTIVERLIAEAAFKKSSENLQVLFDSVNEMIFVLDMQGRIFKVNKTVEWKLGYTDAELHNTNVLLLHIPERRDEALINVQGMIAGTMDSCPVPLLSKNKEIIEVETKVTRGWWDGNEVLIGVSRDVTERKVAEDEIQRQASLIKSLLDSIPDIIFFKDKEGVYLGCNPPFAEFVGKPREEIIGKTDYDLFDKEIADFFRGYDNRMLESGEPSQNEEQITYPDGRKKQIDTLKTPYRGLDGSVIGVLGISRDITRRKRAEEKLHELSDRLSLAVQAGGVGIWDLDLINNILIWDDQMFALYGITREQFSGAYEAWQAGLHPDDRKQGDAEIQQAISGEKVFDTEFRVLWPDGTIRNIRALAVLDRDTGGKPLHLIGTNWDITDQKNAEKSLQENDILLRLILSLSARFINISSDKIYYEISTAIGELGRFAGVDRCYVFLLSDDGMIMQNTHEWCAEGIVPQKDTLQNLSTERFPWWMERLHRFESIHVPCVAELPEEAGSEKKILEAQDIKSNLIVPLISQNTLIGFLGFDSVRLEKTWLESIIILVTITGKSISNAIERERAEEALRKSEFFLKETQQIARLGGWKANPNTNFLEWTDGVYDIIEAPRNYRPGLIEGLKYYAPEDIPVLREKITACLLTGEPFNLEVRLITETGKKVQQRCGVWLR